MKIVNAAGTRPNFMKIAPIINACKAPKQVFYLLLVNPSEQRIAEL
jgi:UDP-N-acetylglucosamine 2-epimerase